MRLVFFEVKRYLYDYKKILAAIVTAFVICGLIFVIASQAIKRKSLYEPFVIGIVNNDSAYYVDLLQNAFNESEGLKNTFTMQSMTKDEAEQKLSRGEIPAYLIIPQNFVRSAVNGTNMPFVLVGTNERPMGLAVTKLMSSAGISFLSSAQSGIAGTWEYCYEQGMDYDDFDQNVIEPLNMRYAMSLLNYRGMFKSRELYVTGALPAEKHYLYSGIIFFLMISSIVFLTTLRQSFSVGLTQKYRVAGISRLKLSLIRVAGLFMVYAVLSVGLAVFFGMKIIVIALCISCFVYMIAAWLDSEATCGIMIFMISILMLFLSGGVVPLVYLPAVLANLKYITINYWALEQSAGSIGVLVIMSVLFFAAAWIKDRYIVS